MMDVIIQSIKNLRREGIRTFLTLIGVVIGIAAIVALLSAGQGLTQAVENELEELGSNIVYLYPGDPYSVTANSTITITEYDLDKIRAITNVTDVLPMYMLPITIEFGNENFGALAMGLDMEDAKVFTDMGYYELVEGQWVSKGDSSSILIGEKVAEEAFDKPINVRKILLINEQEFRVAGIVDDSIMSSTGMGGLIMMSVEAIKKLEPSIGPSETWIRTASASDVEEVSEKIKSYFDKKYGEKSAYVITSEQLLEQVNAIFGLITIFLVGIGSISLIVGGIGIMNAMVTSVVERTKEIGIMKALGASNFKILAIFLLESGFIGIIGGIIGITIGYGLSIIIVIIGSQSGFPLEAAINWEITLGALAFSMLLGMLSGALPAWRAANLDPIEALRYE
ncbi:MAG: ABC transporter permease [archaeon]